MKQGITHHDTSNSDCGRSALSLLLAVSAVETAFVLSPSYKCHRRDARLLHIGIRERRKIPQSRRKCQKSQEMTGQLQLASVSMLAKG